MSILQELYDNEINWGITTFWDAGFYWKLGDEENGILARGRVDTLDDAFKALTVAACEHFPESDFAKAFTASEVEEGLTPDAEPPLFVRACRSPHNHVKHIWAPYGHKDDVNAERYQCLGETEKED